jgi:hypothetical protein
MKKGKSVSVEKVNPMFEKLEQLSKIQRIAIWAGVIDIGHRERSSIFPIFQS